MAGKAATDAIRARLAANWTLTPILGLNADTQTPGDGSGWVRIHFPVVADRKTTLGMDFRETGSARIIVATPIGDGLDISNAWCDQIAAIFRGQRFDGVECYAPSIREGVDFGSYFEAAVIVPYRYDFSV